MPSKIEVLSPTNNPSKTEITKEGLANPHLLTCLLGYSRPIDCLGVDPEGNLILPPSESPVVVFHHNSYQIRANESSFQEGDLPLLRLNLATITNRLRIVPVSSSLFKEMKEKNEIIAVLDEATLKAKGKETIYVKGPSNIFSPREFATELVLVDLEKLNTREKWLTLIKKISQTETEPNPEKDMAEQLIELFFERGNRTLIENMPVSLAMIEALPEKEKTSSPETVGEWLEKMDFAGQLEEPRNELLEVENKLFILSERERNRYWRYREILVEILEKGKTSHSQSLVNFGSYPEHPLLSIIDEKGNFLVEILGQLALEKVNFSDHVFQLLQEEFSARCNLAKIEKRVIEQILDVQSFHLGGYSGWDRSKNEFMAILETVPSRIIFDQEILCVGRAKLVYGMLETIGLKVGSGGSHDHTFLWTQDALGVSYLIDPSGRKEHSYYLPEIPLFVLEKAEFRDSTVVMNLPVYGEIERTILTPDKRKLSADVMSNLAGRLPAKQEMILCQKALEMIGAEDTSILTNLADAYGESGQYLLAFGYYLRAMELDNGLKPIPPWRCLKNNFTKIYDFLTDPKNYPSEKKRQVFLEQINFILSEWEKPGAVNCLIANMLEENRKGLDEITNLELATQTFLEEKENLLKLRGLLTGKNSITLP